MDYLPENPGLESGGTPIDQDWSFNGRLHIVGNDGSVGTVLTADSLEAPTEQMRHAMLA